MRKLVVLASALSALACGESPTQAPLDVSDMIAEAKSPNAAVVNHFKIDFAGCFPVEFGPPSEGDPEFRICIEQTGMIHQTVTRSGVVSFRGDLKNLFEFYTDDVLTSSNYEELFQHALVKDGDLVQLHDTYCSTLYPDAAWSFSSFINVANGEVRRQVVSAEGCDA